MFKYAKIIFYFSQYYKLRLEENIYKYQPELEFFSYSRAFATILKHALIKKKNYTKEKLNLKNAYNTLVYVETINQKNAIIDIFTSLNYKNDIIFYLNNLNGKLNIPYFDQIYFPNKKSFFNALFLFPKILIISRKYIKRSKKQINTSHILINLSVFLSSVEIFEKELKKLGVSQVVVTNDHNLHTLALLLAAKNLNIKSIYIQHASVSIAFPKLFADIALLEGQQAIDIYNLMGNFSKEAHLVGIPRMDGMLGYKNKVSDDKIIVGFCLKPYYSEELINRYISEISNLKVVSKIILRPHPSNTMEFYEILKKYDVEISQARIERPYEFIKKIDVLISGESSIILESALMRVKTIYIDDQVAQYDLYGFVKNKVTQPIDSFKDLKIEIENINFIDIEKYYKNCKYYCSTINTEFENKSKELIKKHLNLK